MNKTEMASRLAALEGIPEYKARRFLDAVAGQIKDTCAAGGTFTWSGLGTFGAKVVKGRARADPRGPGHTGRESTTVDRRAVTFRPSKI